MQIEYLAVAQRDLIDISGYYRDIGGGQLARKMVAKIKSEIIVLADYSGAAPFYEIASNVRRLVVAGGAYLVFYRVMQHVQILHIRRGERAPAIAEDISN